jgi:cell wall assembly regulator SMI1
MQKFTRALTREVEINGERMAVTLSEQGVSFRRVGSRKPPAEITWAAVLAAASGEAAPAAPAPAPAKDESAVGQALARLEAWLAKHRPGFREGLMDPATPGELSTLAVALNRPVPAELASWLNWHNGQGEGEVGSLVGAFNVISSEEIAAEYAERQKGASEGPWNGGWIPLLDDFQGDLVCLDTTRPGHPVIEVWRGKDKAEDVAGSLADWINALVADFEAGKYVEDPERGEFLKKS